MAVEKFYKGADGEYYKVIQKEENLNPEEESKVRNTLQGERKSTGKIIKNKNLLTKKGRRIYKDKDTGENYSERSTTFQMDNGKWITIPTVNTTGGQYNQNFLEDYVRKNGAIDPLTGESLPTFDSEPEASSYARKRSDSLVPKKQKSIFNESGKFKGADYKTGVQGNLLRMRLSGDNFQERAKALEKNVGKDGYVVDKLGNFLLTPKGREKIGQPGKNLLAVDAAGVEVEDFFGDFVGEYGSVTLSSIVGEVAGQRAFERALRDKTKFGKFLRKGLYGKAHGLKGLFGATNVAQKGLRTTAKFGIPALAAGAGAYVGNTLNEAQQYMRDISSESAEEIRNRGRLEFFLGGGASLVGNAITRGIGRFVKGAADAKQVKAAYGEKAYEEWLKTGKLKAEPGSIRDRIERGYLVDIFNDPKFSAPVRGRMIALIEQITKSGSQKEIANVQSALKELRAQFPEELKDFTDKQLAENIELIVKGEGKALAREAAKYRKEIAGAIYDQLSGILELNQAGKVGIDDLSEMYDVVNQAAGAASVQAIEMADILSKAGFKNIENLFVNFDEALGMGGKIPEQFDNVTPEMANQLNYIEKIKGNTNVNNLKFILDEEGVPFFITGQSPAQFIGTQNIREALKQLKIAFPNATIEPGGPLGKLWDDISLEMAGEQPQLLFISPNESNLLIQEMRRIALEGVQGSKFDTQRLWTAAITDNETATAQLENLIRGVKQGKIKLPKNVSPDEMLKGLNQLDEYTAAVKAITNDNKEIKNMFDAYGIGQMAIAAARKEKPYKTIMDAILDVDSPEQMETFIDFFTETIKKDQRRIFQVDDLTGAEYKELVETGKDFGLTTSPGKRGVAKEAIEGKGPVQSQSLKEDITRGRSGERYTLEEKINFVDKEMSSKEIGDFARNEIKKALFKRMLDDNGQITLDNITKTIDQLGGNGFGNPKSQGRSSLEILLGDDTADELMKFSDELGTIRRGEAANVPESTAQSLRSGLAQINDEMLNFTGDVKPLNKALNEFNEANAELKQFQSEQFYKRMQANGYKLENDADVQSFINDVLNDTVSTGTIDKIFRQLDPDTKQAIQIRLIDNFMENASSGITFKDRNVGEWLLDIDNQADLTKFFTKLFKTAPDNAKRFDIIFDGVDENPFRAFEKIKKAAESSNQKSGLGTLVGATMAIAISTAPALFLAGSLGLGSLLYLMGSFGLMKVMANMLRKPAVLKTLSEARIPQKGSISQKINDSSNALIKTFYNSLREQEDDIKKVVSGQRSRINTQNQGPVGKTADRLYDTGQEVVNKLPSIATNLARQAGRIIAPTRVSSTPLPQVNTFDDTIYSELERRRALAGNNPKNQDLVRRR